MLGFQSDRNQPRLAGRLPLAPKRHRVAVESMPEARDAITWIDRATPHQFAAALDCVSTTAHPHGNPLLTLQAIDAARQPQRKSLVMSALCEGYQEQSVAVREQILDRALQHGVARLPRDVFAQFFAPGKALTAGETSRLLSIIDEHGNSDVAGVRLAHGAAATYHDLPSQLQSALRVRVGQIRAQSSQDRVSETFREKADLP